MLLVLAFTLKINTCQLLAAFRSLFWFAVLYDWVQTAFTDPMQSFETHTQSVFKLKLVRNMIPFSSHTHLVVWSPYMPSGWQCRCRHPRSCPCVEPGHMAPLIVSALGATARLIKLLQHRQYSQFSLRSSVAERIGVIKANNHWPCTDRLSVPWTLRWLQRHHWALGVCSGK